MRSQRGSGTIWRQVQSQATPITMNTPSTTGAAEDRRTHNAVPRQARESPAITTTVQGNAPPKSSGAMRMVAQSRVVSGAIVRRLVVLNAFMVVMSPIETAERKPSMARTQSLRTGLGWHLPPLRLSLARAEGVRGPKNRHVRDNRIVVR